MSLTVTRHEIISIRKEEKIEEFCKCPSIAVLVSGLLYSGVEHCSQLSLFLKNIPSTLMIATGSTDGAHGCMGMFLSVLMNPHYSSTWASCCASAWWLSASRSQGDAGQSRGSDSTFFWLTWSKQYRRASARKLSPSRILFLILQLLAFISVHNSCECSKCYVGKIST